MLFGPFLVIELPWITVHMLRQKGIQPFIVKFSKSPETTICRAIKRLIQKNILSQGDRVIVVSDILAAGKFVETVQVRII